MSTTQAYQSKFKTLSEMQSQVGKELGLSPWVEITQAQINQFAEATDDQQWIHTDLERAQRESPYGTTIAHGFLVLSMASSFAHQTYQIDNLSMGINYGMDRVRFPNACRAGARLRGRTLLMEFKEIAGGARFKVQMQMELEGEEKPACVAELIGLVFVQA